MNDDAEKIEIGKTKKILVSILNDEYEIGCYLAKYIVAKVSDANEKGDYFLLGCPSGRSLQSTYDMLGKKAKEENVDLSKLIIVMMDEYVIESANGYSLCSEEAHFSCSRYAYKEIMENINSFLELDMQIKKDNIWLPDVLSPQGYDERIIGVGGIDLFLTASGASDGHVAFNPPGTSLDSKSRIITLADSTRNDNMGTFSEFDDIEDVPKFGISVGLGTIAENSKEIILVIHGEHKKGAVVKLQELGEFSENWPASFIFNCKNVSLLIDKAAKNA